ncbi:amino acid adenylation domain-containing protein [Amycolatopsis sp. NPDC004079]|uniref:amino acid adenylation domain-containing protein n=1 Tax=Amycolatopsis sp. NPDC004079 TaxID=3154549 RepID=UPI0033B94069
MIENVRGGWSGGPAAVSGRTVVDLIAGIVETHGDAPAVRRGGESMSYRRLHDEADAIAAGLRERGIGRGDIVALHLARGCTAVAAAVAVLRAGAAYLALDPALPEQRRRLLVEDAQPALLIGDVLSGSGVPACQPIELRSDRTVSLPEPLDTAYLIYTSGSTGKPKGVQVRHEGLANAAVAGARHFALAPGKRMLQAASWSFDAAVWEIFMALTTGATLVIAEIDELDTVLTDGSVDAALLTPTVAGCLTAEQPVTLSVLGFGGERCGADLIRQFSYVPTLLNCYGPTEASICVAVHRCVPGESAPAVGPPLPGVRAYVLDSHGNPAETGELFLGGTAVAAGYLRRAEQDQASFLPDPFAEGGRMYRTGDLASVSADGVLTVHGRIDDQVKIRGVRVELGEVEAVIAAHPLVTGCGAEVVEGRLIAAVVASAPAVDDLRRRCQETLHPAMVPSSFAQIDSLPMLPSGKLDRSALRELLAAEPDTVDPLRQVHWNDEAERVIAGLFTELCGTAPATREDNLLALGGHSLTAAQISARLRKQFGVVVPMAQILRHPTVPEVAEAVRRWHGEPVSAAHPVALASDDQDLSFGEERLWFLWTIEPTSTAYCVPVEITLDGPVDAARLQAQTSAVLARHDLFRSRYIRRADGTPARRADGPAPLVTVLDLTEEAEPQQAADDWTGSVGRIPFDLATGPLVRAHVLKLAENRHRLVLHLHHIVCDGWSNVVLVEQILAAYAGNEIPVVEATYQDFVRWQQKQLTPVRLAALTSAWREYLRGAPVEVRLSAARTRQDSTSAAAGSLRTTLSRTATSRLHALAARHGVTQFHLLLAALACQLARLTGQQDVVLGSIVGDRPLPELESVAGFFVDTVPIRVILDQNMTAAQAIAAVRASALVALEQAELPFDHVVRAMDPPRVPGMNPVVQVALNVLTTPDVEREVPGVRTAVRFDTGEESKFDLTVYAEPNSQGLGLRWVYRTDLFDQETVREMAEQYVAVLEQLHDDRLAVADILLDSPSRRALADKCVEPPLAAVPGATTASFRRAVAEHPDGIAVSWRHDLTYREIADQVDALRCELARHELDEATCVAVVARRAPSLPIAVLALLEHGVPFSIIDAGLPPAAIDDYLDNLCPAAVLSETAIQPLGERRIPVREGVAYLAHTSGTTGRPKIVLGPKAAMDRQVAWETSAFDITRSDRVALLSGLMYDPCLRDVLVPLSCGAVLSIPEEDLGADGYALSEWLRTSETTIWHTTPGLLSATASGATAPLPHLNLIMIGGDRLRRDDVAHAREVFPNARLVNVYGTTETPQVMSSHDADDSREVVALGSGTPSSRLLVLDVGDRHTGTGEPGEIAVQSQHLALGYRDDADDAFQVAGAVGEVAGPLYRTGDIGWRDNAGVVHLIGRRDDQLKVGGVRVEPAQIEQVLLRHKDVKQVAVRPVPGLTAFVVGSATAGELRLHAQQLLPAPLVPEIVLVAELCYTRNGKLDAELTAQRATSSRDRAEQPATDVETQILQLWSEILRRPVSSPNDDFFRLGGHSLLVTRMLASVRAEFGTTVSFRAFFTTPTVRNLAALVEAELLSELDEEGLALLRDELAATTNDDEGNRS